MSRYVPTFQQYAPAPPEIYDLEEMCERSGVLKVCLVRQAGPALHIVFSDHLGFRKAGESDALLTLNAIGTSSQAGRSFYLVEESDYIRWFVQQGCGVQQAESLSHITIVTIDDVIDVISLSLPSVVVQQ
jgi:hypothetical protein